MAQYKQQPATNLFDDYPADVLGMEAEDMRRLGYKVVDLVVDRLLNKQSEAAILTGEADTLLSQLGGPLPESPSDPDAALQLLTDVALSHQQHGDHPRYFARVPSPSSFAAVLGEWLGTGYNTISASWGGGSGPATIEITAIDWLRQMIGLPEQTEGVFLSGGSMANMTAFATARSELGLGVAYLTDQTHSSLPRALRQMGLPDSHIRILASDDRQRMPMAGLVSAIAADKAKGLRPLMVVATAGTTNTGSVDPLDAIADICQQENMWLHVDGAYGGPAAATQHGRAYLKGLERADSVVLDPHKWLFQPYDIGACFVTRKGALDRCFAMSPEYLADVKTNPNEVCFGNRSLELTRRSRALKVWMSIKTYGAQRFREGIQRGIDLADFAEAELRQQPQVWLIESPAQIGVVCFSLVGASKEEHQARVQALSDSGFACVSSTSIKGRSVLRLCTINPLTTEADIQKVP